MPGIITSMPLETETQILTATAKSGMKKRNRRAGRVRRLRLDLLASSTTPAVGIEEIEDLKLQRVGMEGCVGQECTESEMQEGGEVVTSNRFALLASSTEPTHTGQLAKGVLSDVKTSWNVEDGQQSVKSDTPGSLMTSTPASSSSHGSALARGAPSGIIDVSLCARSPTSLQEEFTFECEPSAGVVVAEEETKGKPLTPSTALAIGTPSGTHTSVSGGSSTPLQAEFTFECDPPASIVLPVPKTKSKPSTPSTTLALGTPSGTDTLLSGGLLASIVLPEPKTKSKPSTPSTTPALRTPSGTDISLSGGSPTPLQSDFTFECGPPAFIGLRNPKTRSKPSTPSSPGRRLKYPLPAKPPVKRGPPLHLHIPIPENPMAKHLPRAIPKYIVTKNKAVSPASTVIRPNKLETTSEPPKHDNIEQPLTAVVTQPAQELPDHPPSYADVLAHSPEDFETPRCSWRLEPITLEPAASKGWRPQVVKGRKHRPVHLSPPEWPIQPATKDRQSRFFLPGGEGDATSKREKLRVQFHTFISGGTENGTTAAGKRLSTFPTTPFPNLRVLTPWPPSAPGSKDVGVFTKPHPQHIPLRSLTYKWWRKDHPQRRHSRPLVPPTLESQTTELQKPTSLAKDEAKRKPSSSWASPDEEWQWVEWIHGQDAEKEESDKFGSEEDFLSGKMAWKCGGMRRGSCVMSERDLSS